MKKLFLCILFLASFLATDRAFAQLVRIDMMVKSDDAGEIKGCGIEVVATDAKAYGVQMQAILYSLGNLNWDMPVHMIAGEVDDNSEFIQESILSASLISEKFGEIPLVEGGKNVSQKYMSRVYPVDFIKQMLEFGYEISYQTETKPDGLIKVQPYEGKLVEYKDGCFDEMNGMIREHYRDFHGDTKCLDDPTSC